MADLTSLPRQNSELVKDGNTTPTWYNFFRRLVDRVGALENKPPVYTNNGTGTSNIERTIVDATTARTLSSDDSNCIIEFTNASAITVTVPAGTLKDDSNVYFVQSNTGQVTVVAGSGVTIDYSDSLKTRTQESMIGLKQIQVDKFELFGDAEPVAPARSALIRSANSVGVPAFVAPTADGQVLKRSSGTLVFGALLASEVTNTPTGTVSATTVQAAIDELATEKQVALTTGTAVLVAGTKVVTTSAVTANSRIMLTVQALGTVAVPKAVGATARTASTSFTITSADATDTSTIAWALIEP